MIYVEVKQFFSVDEREEIGVHVNDTLVFCQLPKLEFGELVNPSASQRERGIDIRCFPGRNIRDLYNRDKYDDRSVCGQTLSFPLRDVLGN